MELNECKYCGELQKRLSEANKRIEYLELELEDACNRFSKRSAKKHYTLSIFKNIYDRYKIVCCDTKDYTAAKNRCILEGYNDLIFQYTGELARIAIKIITDELPPNIATISHKRYLCLANDVNDIDFVDSVINILTINNMINSKCTVYRKDV